MEIIPTRARFYGDGGKYFGILLVNALLTIVTFGLYYPWARAKNLQYLYGETEFSGNRLQFHGTGKEMFKGFVKAILVIGVVGAIYSAASMSGDLRITMLGLLFYILAIICIIPIAIHGGLRYRMSRTSWRGIHFGYRGRLSELIKLFFKNVLLTIVTFGIYGSWMSANIRQYCIGNIRLGNCSFSYAGQGNELFWINVKGFFLSIITFGIYMFWFARDLNHFYINNIKLEQNGEESTFKSNLTAGDIFMLGITNWFLIVFTFGLGTPWALLRQMRMVINNVEMEGAFSPDAVLQTEEDYTNATGDDMLDMLDIGFDF